MSENSTLVVLVKSIGSGYLCVELANECGLKVLEFCPLGGSSQLILQGKKTDINSYLKKIRTGDIDRSAIITAHQEKILSTYLGINSAKAQSHIGIFECQFIGDLFELSQDLLTQGLELVEMNLFKSASQYCYLIATANDFKTIEEKILNMKNKNIKFTLIENISPNFENFLV